MACTLGLLHALHGAYPGARIAWAIQPEFAPLVESLEALERTILFERRGGLGAWWRLRRELRGFAPDLVLDAQGNLKSAAVTWLSGAPRRLGMARAHWQERLGHWVLSESAPEIRASEGQHLVGRMRGLVQHLLGSQPSVQQVPTAPSQAELAAGEALLARDFGPLGAPLLISLSTPGDPRGWSAARWSQLLASLEDSGRAVLVLQGPAEAQRARELQAQLPERAGLRHWAPAMELRCLVGLLAAAATRGSRFLGVDSGPMHLAWSSGLPVTVLEGPCDAARTGPWPLGAGLHRVVRASQQPSCAPCFKRRCQHPEGNLCMQDIRPEEVLEALGPA